MLPSLMIMSCLMCMPVDTPPARMVPAPVIGDMREVSDVVRAARLADGTVAPSAVILPVLQNRDELIEFVRSNYPRSAPGVVDMPVLWVYVDEKGNAFPYLTMKSSGAEALDSLAFRVVRRARFHPALLANADVGLWVPLPVSLRASTSGRPTFTPYTKKPELQNRAAVQSAMVRFYPPALRERGIGGTALMWVLVNEHGEVENVHLKETSGDTLLDRAAEEVVRVMRFSAAMNRNERVKVWVQLPIVFKPAER